MKKVNILITGAGSGVGQSIIRSLNYSSLKKNLRITISDITKENPYPVYQLKYIKFPKVEIKNSKPKIIEILKKNKINILFIGSEYEVLFFSKNKNFFEKKVKDLSICVSDIKTIKISDDKYLSSNFLKENDLPYPKTFKVKKNIRIDDLKKKIKTPFILKNRFGTSSKSVYEIKNFNELKSLIKLIKFPIIQEKLIPVNSDKYNEFTCSFFTQNNGDILGPFLARRSLKFGTSWQIKSEQKNKEVKNLVNKISKKINKLGSFNIQLINTKKGPIPFEFNARFSGTTSVRAKMGFNEPEFFIKNYLSKKIQNNSLKIKNGISFRYISEKFIK